MLIRRRQRLAIAALVAVSAPGVCLAQSSTTTSSVTTTTATSTSTTTTTLACDMAPTFESILCREDALISVITASQEFKREKFRALLLKQINLLKKRTLKAEEKEMEGKRGPAKNWAKGAIRILISFKERLDGLTGKHSVSRAGSEAFLGIATPIRTDLGSLRLML